MPDTSPATATAQNALRNFGSLDDFIQWQGLILDMITKGSSIREILTCIAFQVEKLSTDRLYASILLMDRQGKHLVHGAAPSLPESYNSVIDGIEIGPNVGSCGTAAYTRETIIVENIATDPLWKNFKSLALLYDLKACWSIPLISSDQRVLGTLALYYTDTRRPGDDDMSLIKLFSRTAVIAIEARQAEEEKTRLLLKEKAARILLKEERQHFYRLLMNAPAVIAVLKGADHVFELANNMYLQAVGTERNLLGKPIAEALPEINGQGIIELLDQVYQTGVAYEGKELLIYLERSPGNKEARYFDFLYQPIYNDTSDIEGILVHAIDITEQVIARKRSEASEDRFRSFVLNAPTPIGIYIGREMRIQTVNNAILEAWGRSYEQVIDRTFREVLPELEGQGFYELLEQVYDTGIPHEATEAQVVLHRHGKAGTYYYNFIYSPLKDENGEIYGVMNTASEVTDLVLAKQKLQMAKEQLSETLAAVSAGGN